MNEQLTHAPCGFISLNHESKIVEVNDTFIQWTGFSKEIIGQHFDTILSKVNQMMFHSYFYPTITIEGAIHELYVTFTHADGVMMPYLMNAKRFQDGEHERIDCIFLQMKKRMDYEIELRATKEQLQDAYRAKEIAFQHLEQIYAEIEMKQEELMKINEGLVTITNTDKLTNLYNRKYYQEQMIYAISQYETFGTPLSLLILDIDHFKRVNDTYGHVVGDQVLVQLAKLLQQLCNITAIPCRYGGEEFVVLLPHTQQEEAIAFAQLIQQKVEQAVWEGVGSLTISVGVATYSAIDTEKLILEKADKALYYAKEHGRNQVKHFNTLNQ